MNKQEYQQWVWDVQTSLSVRYTRKEISIILDWFDRIKASKEFDLITCPRVEAYEVFHGDPDTNPHYNLYDSLMIRVWAYAPAILKEHNDAIIKDYEVIERERYKEWSDKDEYAHWRYDAFCGLTTKYSEEDVGAILQWFDDYSYDNECELIGTGRVEMLTSFNKSNTEYNLYDAFMIKLWAYAPKILKENI